MRVLLGDRAVGRPARVAEPVVRVGAVGSGCLDEVAEVADGAHVVECVVFAQRKPRGVVAAVLEPAQAFEQKRLGVARPDVSDDSAHVPLLSRWARKNAPWNAKSPASRPDRSFARGQPSFRVTRAAILAQSLSATSGVSASARTRTTGSVPDGRTRTRPVPRPTEEKPGHEAVARDVVVEPDEMAGLLAAEQQPLAPESRQDVTVADIG